MLAATLGRCGQARAVELGDQGAGSPTALPWVPIFALLTVTMSEGIIACSLFPFLPFMVEDFGLRLSDVGFFAGLLGSAYNFSQFLSGVHWGRLSDVWGRRPVLIIGVSTQAAAMVLFGLSSSLRQALLWRFLGGLLNGNTGVGRAVMRDLTDESNRTRGFALLGTAYGMGFVLGPALGGMLARPAEAFPELFGGTLLETYPYLLPSAASTLGCYPALLCMWFLPSSFATPPRAPPPAQPPRADTELVVARPDSDGWHAPASDFAPVRAPSALRSVAELAGRACALACGSAGPAALCRVDGLAAAMNARATLTVRVQVVLHFVVNGMQELFPLYAANAQHGLGLSPAQLGSSLAPLGLSLLVWPLMLSAADRRFGTVSVFRAGVFLFVIVQALIPEMKALQRVSDGALWAGLVAVSLLRGIAGVTSFTAISVIMNNCIRADAGLVNGYAASMTALARAVAPTLMGAVFALFARLALPWPLDLHMPFYMLSLLSAVTLIFSHRLHAPRAKGAGHGLTAERELDGQQRQSPACESAGRHAECYDEAKPTTALAR